ncbi:MAG: IPTL-CTERM sorting domain-containing protein [Candidatus Dadabacteria bacterium]|nr:IPTL-CTERM sorting domain-containing protein [Candidatus Dadabacteria bacterium]
MERALEGLAFEFGCPISQIPTLSEWGLIAMAGVLGIMGLFILLRKRSRALSI